MGGGIWGRGLSLGSDEVVSCTICTLFDLVLLTRYASLHVVGDDSGDKSGARLMDRASLAFGSSADRCLNDAKWFAFFSRWCEASGDLLVIRRRSVLLRGGLVRAGGEIRAASSVWLILDSFEQCCNMLWKDWTIKALVGCLRSF